jgi:hypothetical protein
MAATEGSERFRACDRMMRRVAWGLWLEQERQRRLAAAAGIDPSVPFWLALIEHTAGAEQTEAMAAEQS